MTPVPFQNEDLTTEKLAELLRSSPLALHIFLQFLFVDQEEANQVEQLSLKVETQHRFQVGKSGRLDLLLHGGSFGIIVECKTRDKPKVYQLEKYYKYWSAKSGQAPIIFWLVRKKAGSMGVNPYLTRELLWDQLHDYLLAASERVKNAALGKEIGRFCLYLQDALILLQPSERATYTPRNKGYNYQFAERVLEEVGASLNGCSYELVAPVNAVTHRLFIGKKAWSSKLEDGFIDRVTLQFKADEAMGKLFWHGNIMLYNRHNVVDPTFAIKQLPRWAPICKNAGLRLLRNLGSEWSGKYSYEIDPPYHVTKPVKYFHAPLPRESWPITFFDMEEENQMVAEGVRIVKYLCKVVDEF